MGLFRLWSSSKKKSQNDKNKDTENGLALAPELERYSSLRSLSTRVFTSFIDYKYLKKGTKNFHKKNLLDTGGFGQVYKAQLDDGFEVAVKKLNCSSQVSQREFENEVILLNRCRHPNIISLRGYSIENDTSFIVYELMHNGTLEHQLHGPSRGSFLTWERRMKIAFDIVKGLEYLHNECDPPIIHRDITSSNLLLDSDFNAKIGDFGLAVEGKEINEQMNLSGTLGYAAPEYLLDGKITYKGDVYAFGVILLELLFGRRPIETVGTNKKEYLLKWTKNLLNNMEVMPNIVDPMIRGQMEKSHLQKITWIAHACVKEDPGLRPSTANILDALYTIVPTELPI